MNNTSQSNFPTADDITAAEEVAVAPVLTEITQSVVALAADPQAMNALVLALLNNKEFRSGLTKAFIGIYDTFSTMYASAVSDFTSTFELSVSDEIPADGAFFTARWLADNEVEFSQRTPTGEYVLYEEPNPAVKPTVINILKEKGFTPNVDTVHYVIMKLRNEEAVMAELKH